MIRMSGILIPLLMLVVVLVTQSTGLDKEMIPSPESHNNDKRNLTIFDFEFKYLENTDLCRTPIINFRTTYIPSSINSNNKNNNNNSDSNSTNLSNNNLENYNYNNTYFELSLIVSNEYLILPKYTINPAKCRFNTDRPSYGYCICPDIKLVNTYNVKFALKQMIGRKAKEGYGTELESQVLSVDVNYIKQRTGSIMNFTAHAQNTSPSVKLSWILKWPKDLTNCITMSILLGRGTSFYGYEQCIYRDSGTSCTYREIPFRETRCIEVAGKPLQRCSYIVRSTEVGTKYSFKLKYTFGTVQYSPFTQTTNVTTLNQVPAILPSVNCSNVDGFPYLRWTRPAESLLYPYSKYRLSWHEGKDEFVNFFSIGRSHYLLKKVELASFPGIKMYLDICTVKGCSQRADACRVKKVILINDNENEIDATLMISICVGVLVFIILVCGSFYLWRRFGRSSSHHQLQWTADYVIKPRLISPYITTTYGKNCDNTRLVTSSPFSSLSTASTITTIAHSSSNCTEVSNRSPSLFSNQDPEDESEELHNAHAPESISRMFEDNHNVHAPRT